MAFNDERERPRVLVSITERVRTAGGNMYVTVSVDERRRPVEVFIRIGKMGETEHAHLTGLGRVLSYALRTGANPLGLIDSLSGITSEPVWDGGDLVLSAEDGVAKALRRVVSGRYDETFRVVLGRPRPLKRNHSRLLRPRRFPIQRLSDLLPVMSATSATSAAAGRYFRKAA